ncbi:L,D-transpeptidase [Albirhodobacter sp. R86504]|jgi:L,D-peptidoglycan transpeptidase YkuD (ErfK/YbiS/YcfS/YnhG family)|uniref:L,D-transpeptidase family protein n=1 Tax=Albirhodobacter sp. R86504 TaxID=3093848 RepID=UPI00366ADFC5
MIRLTARGLLFKGVTYPCTVGRGGLALHKREGDGATPIGAHRIVEMFHRADRIGNAPHWSRAIGPRDLWCDESGDRDYNTLVHAPFAHSHEMLRRADPLYDLVLVTDWNYPQAVAGKGSAIFIHTWRRATFPTAGCIAMRQDHLLHLARRIAPGEPLLVPPITRFRPRGHKAIDRA